MATGDDTRSGLSALVSDAESDPRMKGLSGEPDGDEGEEDEVDGDNSGIEECLNEAYDAKTKGDRAGFVSAMLKAIKGY